MTNDGPAATLPTDSASRIHVIDVLRGFALLGMLVVHFHGRSTDPGGIDEIVRLLVWRLVESKSHGTFALLFGAGFAIQLRRAGARGESFASRYLRRLIVLACFGFAAHAFFGYNVLLGYAVWGVPLLAIRSWSTRALLASAVVCAASVSLYNLGTTSYVRLTAGEEAVAAASQAQRAIAIDVNDALEIAEEQGSYVVLFSARLRHMAWFYSQPFFFMPGVTLTLFIAGLLFVRHGVFERARAHRRLLTGLALFGVLAWLADIWVLPLAGVPTSFGLLRDQWLTFTYVAGALLLFAYRPELMARLRVVGDAGRMALTNYLLQIATLDVLFSGYGLGLGKIRPTIAFAMALAAFAAEAAFSAVWLKQFQFGPAEWLWRSLTYGRIQAMQPAIVSPASGMPAGTADSALHN